MATVDNRIGGKYHMTSVPSCFQKTSTLKWADIALIASFAALLIIGILASTGVLNCIGATNAVYLSYGMYAGTALCFFAEIIKIAVNRLSTVQQTTLSEEQIEQFKKYCMEEKKQELNENHSNNVDKDNFEKQLNAIIENKIFQDHPMKYLKQWINQYCKFFTELKNIDETETIKIFNEIYAQLYKNDTFTKPTITTLKDCRSILLFEGAFFMILGLSLQKVAPLYESIISNWIDKMSKLMSPNRPIQLKKIKFLHKFI